MSPDEEWWGLRGARLVVTAYCKDSLGYRHSWACRERENRDEFGLCQQDVCFGWGMETVRSPTSRWMQACWLLVSRLPGLVSVVGSSGTQAEV